MVKVKNKRAFLLLLLIIIIIVPSLSYADYYLGGTDAGLFVYNYNGIDFYTVGNFAAPDLRVSEIYGDVGWQQEDVGLGYGSTNPPIFRKAVSTFPNITSAPGEYAIVSIYFPGTPQDVKFVLGSAYYAIGYPTNDPNADNIHSNVYVNNQLVGEFIPVGTNTSKYDGPIHTIPASYFQTGLNEIKFLITQMAEIPENRAYRLVFIGPVGAFEPYGIVARNLTASQTGSGQVTAHWDPVAYSNYVVNYKVYVNGSPVGTTNNTLYVISNLPPGDYEISVAVILDGTERPRNLPVNVTVLPDPVTNLQVINITTTTATATWTGTPNASSYKVYLNGALLATTTDTQYNLAGLSPGTTYTVEVSVVESGVESAKTGKSFTTLNPAPVTNLNVTNITTTSATATWTGTPNASSYKVYLNGALLATTTDTQYNLAGLSPGTTYTVEVSVVESGVEGQKTSKSFTTLVPPSFNVYWIIGGNYVKIEWSSNDYQMPAGRMQLWRKDTLSGIWLPVKDIGESEKHAFNFTDTMVTAGLNYKYQVRLYNPTTWDWDIIAESEWAVNERPFDAPTGLRVTATTDTTATVTWDLIQGATTYQVQTSTDSGATWQSSTVGGPPVTVPRPSWVKVKAGTHARSQWSGILRVN